MTSAPLMRFYLPFAMRSLVLYLASYIVLINFHFLGHRNSWNANILHRDISANNILIGLPCSVEGWRGVIIDLDMAIWLTRTTSLAEADFRTVSLRSSLVFDSILIWHDREHAHSSPSVFL